MSRCFPFPPPGYEKKLRIDDASLLAKEHKEKKSKKHKKEKKDKEKKESKEKDKERSKDKRREKHKKEKYREKDREKKEGNGGNPDEKRTEEQPERSYVENGLPADQIEDTAFVQELGRRIRDEGVAMSNKADVRVIGNVKKGTGFLEEVVETKFPNRSAERENFKDKSEYDEKANKKRVSDAKVPRVAVVPSKSSDVEHKTIFVKTVGNGVHRPVVETEKKSQNGGAFRGKKDDTEKRLGEQSQSSNGGRFHSNVQANQLKKCASMQELGKRVRDEVSATQSEVIGRIHVPIDRRAEFQEKVFGNSADYLSDGTNASKNAKVNHGLLNGLKDNSEPRRPKVSIVHKFKGMEQRRSGVIKSIGACVQNQAVKVSSKGDLSDAMGDEEKEMKSKSEDRGRKKEREEKTEADKLNYKMPQLREMNDNSPCPSKESIKAAGERITNKRKEPGSNGFVHGNEVRPNKLPRSHPVLENGRKPELGQPIYEYAAAKESVFSSNHKNKLHKINGVVEAQQPIVGSVKPPAAAPKVKQVDRSSLRTSHPDAKSSPKPTHGDVKSAQRLPHHDVKAAASSPTLPQPDAKAVSPKNLHPSVKTASPKPAYSDVKVAPPKAPHPDVKVAPPKALHPDVKTAPTRPHADVKAGSPRPPHPDVKAPSPKVTNPDVEASSSKRTRPDEKASSLKRPHPHPDTKYLSRILSVPKPEEWSDFDDHEWLFETSSSLPKKVKVDSCSEVEGRRQLQQEVWSKALHLESADISALPYVIPY